MFNVDKSLGIDQTWYFIDGLELKRYYTRVKSSERLDNKIELEGPKYHRVLAAMLKYYTRYNWNTSNYYTNKANTSRLLETLSER